MAQVGDPGGLVRLAQQQSGSPELSRTALERTRLREG